MSEPFGYFFVASGVGALLGGAFVAARNLRLSRRGKTAVGGIVGWKASAGSNGEHYFPEIEFPTDDGRAIRFVSRLASSTYPALAKPVSVLYDPSEPERAELKEHVLSQTGALICCAVGIIFLFVGFHLLQWWS